MGDPRVDALLVHSGWVRTLAASLCRDPGLADDIVQETWLSVLRRGPQDERSLRGWLATVLRRHLRQARRGEERRLRRESARASERSEPAAGDVVELAESHRDLVQSVLELREPFRSTVLLRYLEELAPDEIAARMGIPVATVHSRLARGLVALRERFGEDEDARPTLACVLAWLDAGRGGVALRFAARSFLPVAAGIVALTGLAAVAWSVAQRDESPPEAPALVDAAPGAAGSPERELAPSGAREAGAAGPPPAASSPEVPLRLAGRVLDREGAPVAGVRVGMRSTRSGAVLATSTSGADGAFTCPGPAEPVELVAAGPEHATVLAALAGPERRAEAVLVVAPAVSFDGHVHAEDGTAIAEATLALWVDPYLPVSSLVALDFSRHERRVVASDARGAFRLEHVPGIPEVLLEVTAPGFATRNVRVPCAPRDENLAEDFAIVLLRPAETVTVRGLVRDARGLGVAGALVSAAPAETRTDASGAFELALCPQPFHPRLVALVPGQVAAVLEIELDAARTPLWPEWIELELPERMQTLAGHVRERDGRPVAGARVWLADPTLAETTSDGPRYAEARCADPGAEPWHFVVTDASGAFRLVGLPTRAYRVQTVDPATLRVAEGRAVAGEELELVLEEDLVRVAGRVVSRTGLGVGGVQLRAGRTLFRDPLDGRTFAEGLSLATIVTAADGSFAFETPIATGAHLGLDSDAILGTALGLDELDPPGAALLTVDLRAHFRVELDPPAGRADAFELLDGDETVLPLIQVREGRSMLQHRGLVAGARSLVLAAPETARTLVLFLKGEEVGRRTVTLRPGELEVLRW